MKILISPAKKLDLETPAPTNDFSECLFLEQSQSLINILKDKSHEEISKLMHLSDKLTELNITRYQQFALPFTLQNAKQALFAFKGDVYAAMQADTFTEGQIEFAQKHLKILSGLYGLLSPLDLMQAYRLEMGTKLSNEYGKDLYAFWGDKLSHQLNRDMEQSKHQVIINLASQEYFKAIRTETLTAKVITPVFKDLKTDKSGNQEYKIVGILAKRARGMMCRHIIENSITDIDTIKEFNRDGYVYNQQLSNENEWAFTRD